MSKDGKRRKKNLYWKRKIEKIFKRGGVYDQISRGK